MNCKKCGSNNVNIQRIATTKKKGKGLMYWLLFGWLLDILLWIFLTLPRLIIAILKPKKTKTKVHTEAICQDCGYSWRV
jgi:predicted nucleic-acid-binding Zn-ribbon protein